MADPANDPKTGDQSYNLLQKILRRLGYIKAATENPPPVVIQGDITLQPGDVHIGAVSIEDKDTQEAAHVVASDPAANDGGLVVRNIPSGTQAVSGSVAVSNLPVTQPVSGTVAVSNLPVTQPVSGTVGVNNFPATQPVSGTVAVSNFPAKQTVVLADDASGTKVHVTTDGALLVSAELVEFNISKNQLINGKAAHIFHILGRRAGFNSTNVLQDVGEWLGTSIDAFSFLTGAETLHVVSSNANDTVAGTGAQKVRVTYLDVNGDHTVSADISMNGTTPVTLGFAATAIYWMEVVQTGTAEGTAIGNIDLRVTGTNVIHERITAGGNKSLSSKFKVPTGHTGYLVDLASSNVGSATQDVRLRATCDSFNRALTSTWLFQETQYLSSGTNMHAALPYLRVPAGGRVKVSTLPGATGVANRLDIHYTVICIED